MGPEKILDEITSGILYKNPIPHVKSVHAYFPSVGALPDGDLVATYVLGEAFEAVNLHTCAARSSDGGQTWQHLGPVYPGRTDRLMSDGGKMSVSPEGEVVVNFVRHDRTDHPDEGLTNPATMGFVPTEMRLVRSTDGARSWKSPETIEPPLVGPAFELCSPITYLRDGRWLLPTSTWLDWEGNLPNGNRMVAFVSPDRGRTWPSYLDVMHSPDDNLIFWESRIVELSDGCLLAGAWCFDRAANADRPNQYAVSRDGGATWTTPQSTGLQGQTLALCALPDDRVVCIYRRMDKTGLWANLLHIEGDRWVNDGCQPLWGHQSEEGRTIKEENMVHTFNKLKFGAPSIIHLGNRVMLLAFWCYEENVSVIRWFRFTVQ